MTVIQIQATGTCAGGEHVTIQARLDGGAPQTTVFAVAQMPLIQLHARGKSVAQLRADLLAGISVTV
jgi:hypothetical protein